MAAPDRPRILTLGGLDPGGGAGITADARMIAVLGGEPLTVASCLTVQSRRGFRRAAPCHPDLLRECLAAVAEDGVPAAVKTGLFADTTTVEALAGWLAGLDSLPPLVVDPVLSSTAPGWRGAPAVAEALRRELLPFAALVTPNHDELARLTGGGEPRDLLTTGCAAVLAKGGHGEGRVVVDRLVTPTGEWRFEHPRSSRGPVHGTGCALAAAIATRLGRGESLEAACRSGIDDLLRCLAATPDPGDGLPVPLWIP